MARDIELNWNEASDLLAALESGIEAAATAGLPAAQIQLEDAFALLADKMFPDLPHKEG